MKEHFASLRKLSLRLTEGECVFHDPSTGESCCLSSSMSYINKRWIDTADKFDAFIQTAETQSYSEQASTEMQLFEDKHKQLKIEILLLVQTLYKKCVAEGEECSLPEGECYGEDKPFLILLQSILMSAC